MGDGMARCAAVPPQGTKKALYMDFIHIQRRQNAPQGPENTPLVQKWKKRYNSPRNVPIYSVADGEFCSPFAGGRCATTCLCIAFFFIMPYSQIIPLFGKKSRGFRFGGLTPPSVWSLRRKAQ